MSYAAVMVYVDPEADCGGRIRIAANFAKQKQATLIGIGGWFPGPGFASDVAVIDDDPVKHETAELEGLMRAAERRFRAAAQGLKEVEWRGALGTPLDHLAQQSRSADLVVIGVQAPTERHCVALDPGAAVLRMGRPVVAVPTGVSELRARRIVIAWKDCREARRAIRDSLEILQQAEDVLIVEVSERTLEQESLKGLDDLANYLRRHRIAVGNKLLLRRTETIASHILNIAEKEGADLLVAGAYGHSRLGEWAFGGVTRDLLRHSAICCLLAH